MSDLEWCRFVAGAVADLTERDPSAIGTILDEIHNDRLYKAAHDYWIEDDGRHAIALLRVALRKHGVAVRELNYGP